MYHSTTLSVALSYPAIFSFRKQGLWVDEDIMNGVQSLRIEEWPLDAGKSQMQSKSGSINVGDDYGSKFIAIYPMKALSKDGKKFLVKMKIDDATGSKTRIYHSINMKSWTRVNGVSYNDGIASFQSSSGMYRPLLVHIQLYFVCLKHQYKSIMVTRKNSKKRNGDQQRQIL